MTGLLIRRTSLLDGSQIDVRVSGAEIVDVACGLDRLSGEPVVDADGGALLAGLHDHHVHLLATAAAATSLSCGPPRVRDRQQFADVLAAAARAQPAGGWVRGVGYHQDVAGDLDRRILDGMIADRPVRIQHRSGAVWYLNSAALDLLDLGVEPVPAGVERDDQGRPTGRLWRVDRWLRGRLGPSTVPDLAALGRRLAAMGVTGVTDATPDLDDATVRLLADAAIDGTLPQRLCLLGADWPQLDAALAGRTTPRVQLGPRKLVLADHDLPTLPDLVGALRQARRTGAASAVRPVAVHCVSRVALILLLAALHEVGSVPGDRIEHASVVPGALLADLAALGVTVVTQPGLVATRGDDYLRDVDPDDLPGLYRHASLLRAGVPVALSSDAPHTDPDPWATIRAATTRTTPTGAVIGPDEAVTATQAVHAHLAPLENPGGTPRRVRPGVPADLVLLDHPWGPHVPPVGTSVRLTITNGRIVHDRDGIAT